MRDSFGPLPDTFTPLNVTYQRLDLSSARAAAAIDIGGANCLAIVGSTAPLAYALASFSAADAEKIPLREGLVLRGVPFDDLVLTHVAQPDQYLGLWTMIDPSARFDMVAPPPWTIEDAIRSGWGFQGQHYAAAVVGESAHCAIINDTAAWVAVVSEIDSNTAGGLELGIFDSNLAITGAANVSERTAMSAFGNYEGDTTANERANQCNFYAGTSTITAHKTGMREQVGGSGQILRDMGIPVLPGFHLCGWENTVNSARTMQMRWVEIPLELWNGS